MRGTAIARLATVCAVLVGLFLMHGLPAQACPAGAAMPVTAMNAASHTEHPRAHDAPAASAEHGSSCVFTPAPRGIDSLLALLLLAATAALLERLRPAFGGGRHPGSRRAPPRAGAELLTALCVSRT